MARYQVSPAPLPLINPNSPPDACKGTSESAGTTSVCVEGRRQKGGRKGSVTCVLSQ